MPPELLALLVAIRETAAKKSVYDDEHCDITDYYNGNYDDVLSLGVDEGEIQFARGLLAMIEE